MITVHGLILRASHTRTAWIPPGFDKPYSHRVMVISLYLNINLPLGVTNEGREAIKLIFGAIAGDSSLQDRGVAHYLLPLLVSLFILLSSYLLLLVCLI